MWTGMEMELLLSDILGTDDDEISRRLEDEVEIRLLEKPFPSFHQGSRPLSSCGSALADTKAERKPRKR